MTVAAGDAGAREAEADDSAAEGVGPHLVLGRPLVMFAASRLVVLLAAGVAALVQVSTGRAAGLGPWPSVPQSRYSAVAALERWDGAWWISIAQHGYPHALSSGNALGRFAFFPLYPLGIRAVALTGLPVQYAALGLSTGLGAGAAVLFWHLARRLTEPGTADRACALFCFFPGSLVLSMAYSEALMLLAALGCLLALERGRWLFAGVAAAVATATRPTAVALCFACAWAAASAISRRRQWQALLAPLLSPVGALAYFSFLAIRTGRTDAWFVSERDAWHERFDLVGLPTRLVAAVHQPVRAFNNLRDANPLVSLIGVLVLVALLALLVRWRPPAPVLVFTLMTVVLIVGSKTIGARPRLVLSAFPLLIALAHRLSGWGFLTVLSCCAVALGALTVLSLTTLTATP